MAPSLRRGRRSALRSNARAAGSEASVLDLGILLFTALAILDDADDLLVAADALEDPVRDRRRRFL